MSPENAGINDLIRDLQVFLELSFQEDDLSLREWIDETINKVEGTCWTKHRCNNYDCPAYQNECGRCWLIAGTMCGGRASGSFVEKYGSCMECDVYNDAIGNDSVKQLRELIIALIHSLRLKQQALQEALAEVRTLSGFLPICASCKKIRDDRGYWNQIEAYIREHSDAEFSHGLCPECAQKLYPDLMDNGAP
ncbi:MAG: hypothetical protein Kow0089_24920 [Desulfobulbaceae bacterium]